MGNTLFLIAGGVPTKRKVAEALAASPLVVTPARSARELLRLHTAADSPDVVLYSRGRRETYSQVVRRLRADVSSQIIVIGPDTHEAKLLDAVEAGADDWLCVPPSSMRAVYIKIMRTAPRGAVDNGLAEVTDLGGVMLDSRSMELQTPDFSERLTPTELKLICCLVERAGLIVTRDQLESEALGWTSEGGSRALDVHVARLRSKLGRCGGDGSEIAIETIPGVGYRLLCSKLEALVPS